MAKTKGISAAAKKALKEVKEGDKKAARPVCPNPRKYVDKLVCKGTGIIVR